MASQLRFIQAGGTARASAASTASAASVRQPVWLLVAAAVPGPEEVRAWQVSHRGKCCGRTASLQALTAQLAVPLVPLVCLEANVGDGSLPSAGVLASLRLFVSAVKPSLTQAGAEELVAVKAVC